MKKRQLLTLVEGLHHLCRSQWCASTQELCLLTGGTWGTYCEAGAVLTRYSYNRQWWPWTQRIQQLINGLAYMSISHAFGLCPYTHASYIHILWYVCGIYRMCTTYSMCHCFSSWKLFNYIGPPTVFKTNPNAYSYLYSNYLSDFLKSFFLGRVTIQSTPIENKEINC